MTGEAIGIIPYMGMIEGDNVIPGMLGNAIGPRLAFRIRCCWKLCPLMLGTLVVSGSRKTCRARRQRNALFPALCMTP